MDPYVNKNVKSTISKERHLINGKAKHRKTKSTLKKEYAKKYQKNVTSTALNTPQRRSLRFAHSIKQTLNKCEQNMFEPSIESCNSNETLNKISEPHVIKVEHKSMLKHNLLTSTHFCNKPAVYCDSCNYIFYDKMLTEHCNTASSKSDIVSQHMCSHAFKIKHSQKESIELLTYESTGQSTSETNVQSLINSKCESECYISMQIKGEDKDKTNKPINIEKSKRNIYREAKKQRITKAACNFEINEDKQQTLYHAQEKYNKCTNKIVRSKYFKRTLEKENRNSFSKNTITELNTNDIKIKNEMVMYKNCTGYKKLTVPLVKLEDLPLSELSTLICTPNYVESRPKKQENNILCQTENITKIYKQYRTSKLEQNQEIHVLCHTPKFGKRIKTVEKNIIKQIDRNLTNIKFETNNYNVCSKKKIDNTKILQSTKSNLQTTHLLQNILQFFIRYKTNIAKRKRKRKLNKVWKSVAMCVKCKEVFRLLQQFSDKINFLEDEKLCIKCTLCNLEINSLSSFQQHVMNIHLQCEGKLLKKKQIFAVEIINFNEQLNLNNNDKIIFECYCCSKVFNHETDFEEHINKKHYATNDFIGDITRCKTKELIETSELYTTHKNEQIFNKNQALNRNLIFNITTNMTAISNHEEENEVQYSNHMNEYYINTKNIIYHSSSNNNLLLKMEEKKEQMNGISQSTVTQITEKASSMKKHMADLNTDESCSTLNNILKIPFISDEHSNIHNNKSNQTCKKRNKGKNCFPYHCKICPKKYKRKNMFLSHMSKHVTNSNINIYQEQKAQETAKDDSMTKFENGLTVSSTYNKYFQDCTNSPNNNNTLNSNINLEETNQSSSISEIIDEGMDKVKCENIVCVMKKDNTVLETDDDCNYILHVNLTQNLEKGIKRQKSMKFNINVTKKYKTDNNGQQDTKNEIENSFPINLITNTNSVYNTNKGNIVTYRSKEMYCNICDKKFNSEAVLREHMLILHNILVEDSNLSDIPMIRYFNNCRKTENLSIKNNHVFKEKHVSSEIKISRRFVHKENKIHEKPIYRICNGNNINKRSKKWRCNSCKENFALLRNYLRHKYYYHNDESVVHICDNCNKVLTSVAMVNIHMCTNVTSWNCKRCYLSFSNSLSLTQHNMNYHLETIGPHVCKICKLSFLTVYMLERHISTHSVNGYHKLNNHVESSISTKNYLPYILLNNRSASTEFITNEEEPIVNETASCTNTDIENSKELNELNGMLSDMCITSSMPCNGTEIFQCKLCYTWCITKIQMKLHLEKWHNSKIDICQICNELYFVNELTKHLICHHIVSDNLFLRENNINLQVTYRQIAFQNNLIKILGLKRLLSLYEYQRFDDIAQNKCFNCIICSKQLTSIQCYKIHYLQHHDVICLLCNVEFKDNFQAFEHKTKIHTSIDLYLWVVQNLTLAILQLNEHGSTIEEMVLKYSEIRI
ncbi:Zinc finger protein 574 [Anthophora quadrimaculata]